MEDFNPDDEPKELKREEEEEGDLVGHDKFSFTATCRQNHVYTYASRKIF